MGEPDVRQWFLTRGLPLVVSRRWRARRLVRRSAPAVAAGAVLAAVGAIGLSVFEVSDAEYEQRSGDVVWELAFWSLAVAAVVLPVLVFWLVGRAMRTKGSWPVAVVAYLVELVVVPVFGAAITDVPVVAAVAIAVGLALLALGFVYFGGGSVLSWALRYAVSEVSAVGQTMGRTLPLLLITLVVFFTGELWQWSAAVSRGEVWGTVGLFAAIGVAFMVTSMRDEVRQVEQHRGEDVGELLSQTPFAGTEASTVTPVPLGRGERANVLGKLLVAQLIQVLVFGVLIMVFFVVLGTVMLPDSIIHTWSSHAVEAGTLFGGRLPIPQALLQMSLFMAALSGLYFAVNTSTDDRYRDQFFAPLIADVAVTLTARDAYLAQARHKVGGAG